MRPVSDAPTPPHRLVAVGDSLTHGFQSGAIFNTRLSYPAIIAHELGFAGFRYPRYEGQGGLPLNVEYLLRDLERRYGTKVSWYEVPGALRRVRDFMDQVEDYWERGPGATIPENPLVNHDLAVYGYDLRDALERTANDCLARLTPARDNIVKQVPEFDSDRAALRVFPTAPPAARDLSLLDAARVLGEDNPDGDAGIETLIVFLGANNALGCVTHLTVNWSGPGYDDLERKQAYNVWRPIHFARELLLVRDAVARIRARHVIWCTVPHVTIAPIAMGVGDKMAPGSRYFPYYTRPWIAADRFQPGVDPALTGSQARAVDSAIDHYNDEIVRVVKHARLAGRDWRVCDVAGVLDRLATRRYLSDPAGRPAWWTPYPLPDALAALVPVPDSRFLTAVDGVRATGGLFSLDGVHPTTVAYGILAQEIMTVMRGAGVVFRRPDGTPRPEPVTVDFARLVEQDTLIRRPPGTVMSALSVLGWADERADMMKRAMHLHRRTPAAPVPAPVG
ncbi:MAG TPA: hypothetical protein VHA75_04025 [Rugosimonospora sp.]|nr:hypothetical protein [Rugosimonospora sp.]